MSSALSSRSSSRSLFTDKNAPTRVIRDGLWYACDDENVSAMPLPKKQPAKGGRKASEDDRSSRDSPDKSQPSVSEFFAQDSAKSSKTYTRRSCVPPPRDARSPFTLFDLRAIYQLRRILRERRRL